MSSGNLPYPLFSYSGLVAWVFFSNSILQAANSVVGSQNLVTKVYFPRLYIPIGAVGAGLIDFAIAFGMLPLLIAYFVFFHDLNFSPDWKIVLLPLMTLGLLFAALGVGIFNFATSRRSRQPLRSPAVRPAASVTYDRSLAGAAGPL